jgi:TonB family protein
VIAVNRSILAMLEVGVLMFAGCAAPHYVFDKQHTNDRRKPFTPPTNQTTPWKNYDKLVALFPNAKNLPRYQDLVGHTVQPPKIIDTGKPVFPQQLVTAHQQGRIDVLVLVSETGRVIDAKVLESTNPSLTPAALASTKRWKFSPATIDGKPCKFTIGLPYDFRVTHSL